MELNGGQRSAGSTRFPLESAVKYQAVVFREELNAVSVAVADKPNTALQRVLSQYYPGKDCRFYVTTHWDISQFIRANYKEILLDQAVYGLVKNGAEVSAYTVLTQPQFIGLALMITGLALCLYHFPVTTLIIVNLVISLAFLASIAFKFIVSMAGLKAEHELVITQEEIQGLNDDELPLYTILVPVYKEERIVSQIMKYVATMDYPSEKLEIFILIEEDDNETWEAAKGENPPDFIRLLRIPDALPKTKPKACNVGLSFARGKYLVIYDAEDRPEPDQLKKAVLAFQKGSEHLICVQAALNYFNWSQNWLTRMFTLEYSYWFDYMLPGLQKLKLPIPLGGTSNHFRTDRLIELGGWDPFNVTEDADLGIRSAAFGYGVGVINSTTFEEANSRYYNWIRQRSRWIKGYMQTVLVYSRSPVKFLKTVGLKQAMGFAFLIGGTPVTCLLHLPTLILYLFWITTRFYGLGVYFPPLVLYLGLFNFLIGNALGVYLSMMGVFKRNQYTLTLYSLFNPIYWIMHSIASYKALWQLLTKPFYWEKTLHGLSDTTYTAPIASSSQQMESL